MSSLPTAEEKHRIKNIPALDLLRALAITMVFLYHYSGIFPHPEWIRDISKFGWSGVDLFFVLSGFLIASQIFREVRSKGAISFRSFFAKRFFRIIPNYLLVLLVYFLIPSFREREALAPLWKYLTFTQNLGLDLSTQGTFSHAWSLCIEEQFYLILPIVLAVLIYYKALHRGFYILIALFFVGILLRLLAWYYVLPPPDGDRNFVLAWYKWIYYPTYTRLDGLLVGVSIAALVSFNERAANFIKKYAWIFLLLGVIMLVLAYNVCLEQQSFAASIFGFTITDIGYGLLLMGMLRPNNLINRRRSFVIYYLATLSYALYLSHKIVIHVAQDHLSRLGIESDSNLMFICCALASLLVALVMHFTIERLALILRNRFLRSYSPH